MLESEGRVVGVHLAFRSEREVGGRRLTVCNLGAWCVLDTHRAQGLLLLRSLLRTGADLYTDLSPSGSVIPLEERLGFSRLDTSSLLRPNVPRPWRLRGVRLLTDPDDVAAELGGRDAEVFRDHRDAAAARHAVIVTGDAHCYVLYRQVRRKGLPVFASLVHVGDPAVLVRGLDRLAVHLLREGLPLLLAERRVAGAALPWAVPVEGRPKTYRGDGVRASEVDDLYSEITCVPW